MSSELCAILAIAILLVVVWIFVSTANLSPPPRGRSGPSSGQNIESREPQRPSESAGTSSGGSSHLSENGNDDMFFIEYVPADMRELATFLKMSLEVRDKLFAVGDALLDNLPKYIRDRLGQLMSIDEADTLSLNNDLTYVDPERIRAVIALAEVIRTLQSMMFSFGYTGQKFSYRMAIDGKTGNLVVGEKIFTSTYITSRIVASIGVNLAMATAIWWRFVKILRDGAVAIPGIRRMGDGDNGFKMNASA